jgi:hypothetical protein
MGREQAVNLSVSRFSASGGGCGRLPALARVAKALVLSPDDFGRLIADETRKWGKAVKFAGITAD